MNDRPRRLRIGIDTGGTFTDVVAYDEESGELTVTKTPTTPADPSIGFIQGLAKVLDQLGDDRRAVAALSHGTTIATNQLLEGKIGRLGFITTEGFEFMLEIARQSVPDGYGNSYFWVKPPRIVPADLVKTVGGRLDHTGAELRPFDEAGAVAVARWFRDHGVGTLGVCFLHSYANPEHERRMAAVIAREHPKAVVSISSEVLREYRQLACYQAGLYPPTLLSCSQFDCRTRGGGRGERADADGGRRAGGPRAGRDHRRQSCLDRERGRDGHRAHGQVADGQGRPRLQGRDSRPAAA